MPKHLIKCRKSSQTSGTKECRFNMSHVVPTSEIQVNFTSLAILYKAYCCSHKKKYLQQHEATCPDRVLVDFFVNHRLQSINAHDESGFGKSSTCSIKSEKAEWDDIPEYPSFNIKSEPSYNNVGKLRVKSEKLEEPGEWDNISNCSYKIPKREYQ